MLLSRYGRKEVRWTVTTDVEDLESLGTPRVQLADEWYDATLDGSDVMLIVAGEDAPDPGLAPDAAVLPVGMYAPLVRFDDNPEVLVEDAGVIVVT